MAYKKTLIGPHGLKLVLDHGDAATPAMVYDRHERNSATYDCASDNGVLMGDDGDVELTPSQLLWLEKHIDAVEAAFETARKDNPEYD